MVGEVVHLRTVSRILSDGGVLMEAVGIPEVAVLDASEEPCRAALGARARAVLEDPEASPAVRFHRRRGSAELVPESVEMQFEPPRRSPEWQEPVRLTVHYVRWEEDGLHHALIPALAVRVFGSTPEELARRVPDHIRLILGSRGRPVGLRDLAELERIQALSLGGLEVGIRRRSPLELARNETPAARETSMLATLAEELPPRMAGPADSPRSGIPGSGAVFEMESELRQLAETLGGPHRQSVLLVGPPGSGKTALVRELARRRGEFGFRETPFWTTTGARLMSGPVGFGMWQERCREVCREAAGTRAILHLGNLAELLEVGRVSRSGQSVGSYLRPWIARGEFLVVAECTPDQLGAIERTDPQLPGVFRTQPLSERTDSQARAIVGRVFDAAPGDLDADPRASSAALDRLHALHRRYATYSAAPGRPLRFLRNLLADRFPTKTLGEAEVIAAFSRETGLPAVLLDDRLPLDPATTRDWFVRRVIGQPEATERILDLLAIVKARLARPRKPLASFLFIGPTGTGKTEMSKALAEFLFGDAGRMVRFDLNEFADAGSVERLIGGPLAAGDEGLLTARVREQPFGVVLLDEFEKAHPSLFDLLLQVLGDGRLTDGAGRVADFCNTVIVMTTNLGAQSFQRGTTGFRADGRTGPDAAEHFADAVRRFLRPELYNRFDAIVPFRELTPEVVLAIASRQLDLLRQRDGLRLRPVECVIAPEVASHLARRGYDVRYGARPLKRALEREVGAPLAEALNAYSTTLPLRAEIGVADGRIRVQVRARGPAEAEAPDGAATDARRLALEVMTVRRRISRLVHGDSVGRLENEVALLERLERRLAGQPQPRTSPDLRARLEALPPRRDGLRDLRLLADRAGDLEANTLIPIYRREPPTAAVLRLELARLETERRRLVREVYRFQQSQPDRIVLAVFAEPRTALVEMVGAYLRLAADQGLRVALDYFEPPDPRQPREPDPRRFRPGSPAAFLAAPPDKAAAAVLEFRGDLAHPLLAPEQGLHTVKRRSGEQLVLVMVVEAPFEKYLPKKGIFRPGALANQGVSGRRTFEQERGMVKDRLLGERPWSGGELAACVAELVRQQFEAALEEVTG